MGNYNPNRFECDYANICPTREYNKDLCMHCVNNRLRNYKPNYFENARDAVMSGECPRLRYDGPAEQTAGYKCPVCGGFTNPYQIDSEKRCKHCGYILNVG